MQRFAELFEALDASTGTRDKVAAMRAYFAEAAPADAAWAVAVLSGRKLGRAVSSTRLREWAAQESGYPPWLIAASHEATGDLGEALALVLPHEGDGEDIPLHEVVERRVRPLGEMSLEQQRETIVDTWRRFDARRRFLYHKLISSSFRVGVQKKLVIRALAEHAGLAPATVAMRFAGSWQPTAENFRALLAPEGEDSGAAADRPYPFCLAYPLEVDLSELGEPGDWLIERKWDGIRAQAIRRGESVYLWSRGEELVTEAFPEITEAMRQLDCDVVLDGEIVGWEGERPLPFTELQKRLNRKRVEPSLFPDVPVAFVAYDLLELDGEDQRSEPMERRRARLESLLDRDEPTLRLSPRVDARTWDAVRQEVQASREKGVEGLMLKRRDSVYGVGRQRGTWWKWKVAPYTVDAVLVQAEQGHGRRAGLFTAYTFAVWDREPSEKNAQDNPGSEPASLVNVTRAYSGLTNDEIEKVDRWIRDHTVAKHGPVRIVEPYWVFEIAFEGLQRSPRHKAGLALRFPRMNRWRTDKAVREADTLERLTALLP
ncbi:MAG: ATP-dependent DNA ligase, partial [Phycisphaeraceae bacterium]